MAVGSRKYLIAVDIGTSRAKTLLYRIGGGVEAGTDREYGTLHPKPGYVEQDADEVLRAVIETLAELVRGAGLMPKQVQALCFAGIWQSLLLVDEQGRPLHRASTWADSRATEESEVLRSRISAQTVRERTGCSLHPMYFLPRLAWLRNHRPELLARTARIVSIKEYVLYHLFGRFAADRSVASGTGIWNMGTGDWDAELLREVGVHLEQLSPVLEPTEIIGGLLPSAAQKTGLLAGTPGVVGGADGALSHLASCGLRSDRMSITVGTGAGLRRLVNGPVTRPPDEAWCYYLAEGRWLLGGIVQAAGNVVAWLTDSFLENTSRTSRPYERLEALIASVPPGSDGLLILPLLAGERCPHDRPKARGVVYGLTFSHGLGHLARATLEGIAYVLQTVQQMLAGEDKLDLVLTGGMSSSPVWLQLTADFFGLPLLVPKTAETSAWGAVLLGLRAVGALQSLQQIEPYVEVGQTIVPDPQTHAVYAGVRRSLDALYRRLYVGGQTELDAPG